MINSFNPECLSVACFAGHAPTILVLTCTLFFSFCSGIKRSAIIENARELGLGGISKVGYPGIVIVEGDRECAWEFVRRIQRMRWKYFVVRGEEEEEEEEEEEKEEKKKKEEYGGKNSRSGGGRGGKCTTGPRSGRQCRKLPMVFIETDGSMAEVAAFCREHELHDLFMTCMKNHKST